MFGTDDHLHAYRLYILIVELVRLLIGVGFTGGGHVWY